MGLTFGIILAGVLASIFNVALNNVLLTWLGMTVGLGCIGWIVGDRLSSRFPALDVGESVVVNVPSSEGKTAMAMSNNEEEPDDVESSQMPPAL
jgi:hypothetical protein